MIFTSKADLYIIDLAAYATKLTSGRMHERPRTQARFSTGSIPVPDAGKAESREQRLSKVCAKFQGGVKWGLGMHFERTCRDDDCKQNCSGSLFHRQCRLFEFRPHYDVKTISGFDAMGVDFKVCNELCIGTPPSSNLIIWFYSTSTHTAPSGPTSSISPSQSSPMNQIRQRLPCI